MAIQFLCPTCRKHYSLAEQFAGATVQCEACQQLMSVPAAQPILTESNPLGLSDGAALSGSPLLPPARKSNSLPRAAWIGIAATALVAVIVAIVVVLLNKNNNKSGQPIARGDDLSQPAAAPPESFANHSPTRSSGGQSINNVGTPTAQTPSTASTNAATPPAPLATKVDATDQNATTAKQTATSAAPPNRWLKPFVPKNDDSASSERKAKQSVSAAPTIWNVKPDPAPQQITSGEIKWAEVEVPVVDRGHGMAHPLRPSPFVAVYGDDRGKRYVGSIDLRDGKKKGPFAIDSRGRDQPRLNLNGKYLAWLESGPAAVQIYSLDDGKPVQRINVGDKVELKWFDFVDGANLVTYTSEFGNKDPRAELWGAASGEMVRRFDLPADSGGNDFGAATVSPGGAHLLLAITNGIYVFEIASGKLVGELRLPPLSDRDEEGRHVNWLGLACSWNGAELAGLMHSLGSYFFVVWAVDTGKVVANIQTADRLHLFGRNLGSRLEWFGNDGLFVDRRLVFHRDSLRQPVDEFKGRTEFRRMLSWNKAVAIDSGRRARGLALQTMKLSGDELIKRVATLRAGGELAETGLPPLKSADYHSLMQVDLTVTPDGWDVKSEPVKAADGLKPQINLSLAPGDQFKKALFADAHAIVFREVTDGGLKRFLDRFDLQTANRDATVEIYPDSELIDASADGSLALVRSGNRTARLDIIGLTDRKHVVGWKPYAEFPGEKGSNWNLDRAIFVGNDHLVTMRKSNELIVWKIPECQALLLVSDAWNVQLSDDGRYFITRAHNDSAWAIHETLTGKPCGRIAFGSDADLIDDVAFDPVGKRLAMLRHQASYSRVALVDLATGQPSGDLALPPPARRQQSSVSFVGPGHLLIDGHLLADITRGCYLLNYSFEGEPNVDRAGHVWIAAGQRRETLMRADLPSKEALAHAAQAQIPTPSLNAGGRISLSGSINVPGVSQDAFLKLVYDNLAKRGFVVDPQAPIRLHVEASEQGTGQTMQLRTFGRVQGKTEFDIAGLEIPVKAVLSMPGGAQYPVYQTRYSNNSTFVRLKENQNPEQYLQDEMRESFTRSANGITAPLFAFDAPAEANAPRVVWQNGQEQFLPPGTVEVQPTPQ